MPSERNSGGGARAAVVYVGSPAGAGGDDAADRPAARVALRQAERAGLVPLPRVARTVAEAEALLAEHPDAVLVVHPGAAPDAAGNGRRNRLWDLLTCGVALRLCEPAGAEPSPSGPAGPPAVEPAPVSGGGVALLVVDLPRESGSWGGPAGAPDRAPDGGAEGGPAGAPADGAWEGGAWEGGAWEGGAKGTPADADTGRRARREAECRGFAARLGLSPGPVLADHGRVWALELGRALMRSRPLTALVHPEITPPAPDTPDGVLWRWLLAGREIRPGAGPVTRQERFRRIAWQEAREGELSARRVMDQPPEERHRQELDLGSLDRAGAEIEPPGFPDDAPIGRRAARYRYEVGEEMDLGSYAADEMALDVQSERSHRRRSAAGARSAASARVSHGAPPGRRPALFRRSGEPLPHDGLFIRRNNAFGTRSPLGVRDLIEQGVIIGQEQIRFDDFVAARTEQVPGPPPGRAVGVSHGLTAVQGDFRADEATTHFLEITLKAGEAHPGDAPAEPLPVNFVFVVDTSGSMHGEKLDCVKAALQALYDRLRPTDCLGIITFDHHVRTALAATARQDLPSERFAQVVSGLSAGGGTDINLGVQYGIDEIGRNALGRHMVNCLYVFSDGSPTSGERDWIRIRTNIAAKLRGDLTLSCFGFGSDARMPELAALAGLAGGHSTFVTRPEQVGTDLLADLNRRDHLAAIDIQLRLDIAPDVEIRHLYGHDLVTDPRARAAVLREAGRAAERARADYGAQPLPDLITEEKGIRIFAPDLAFGETYWIVLELAVPPGRGAPEPGSATVQYVDTVTRAGHRHDIDLSTGFTLAEETVTVHAVGLWTSEVTFYALDDLYDRDRDAATKRLTHHIQVLRAAHDKLPAREFRDDQVTLQKLITLTSALDTVVSFSDTAHGPGAASAVMAMNDFGRVRSGFWPQV
ncbi:VWA domain-containing protein [Streptomyces sp. NPDC014864]|uniref:VWA domain-containing protein n=1 Tax=Streptomyces sp. NPDC014864 TaxID=3364924 RepID=UPI0036FB44E0